MTDPIVSRVGGVLSADIAVDDFEREVRFYSRVLCTGADPLWREDLKNNLGTPVIGLGPRSAEYADLPLQWMPHIQVADVAASARRALELGGRELMHGKDDTGRSQWAVLLDPNDAAFGIVPVVPEDAARPAESVASRDAAPAAGRICWLDLTVPDASSTREFYREVVGWSVDAVAMHDANERYSDYAMLAADGTAVAGVCHARGPNRDLPPVWMIYLPVGDLAESLRRVEAEGGRIVKASRREDGTYAYAAIRDPAGAHLALVPG